MEKATNVLNGKRFISLAAFPEGKESSIVESKFILWTDFDETAAYLSKYLTNALKNGTYFAYPPINVVGKGIEAIPDALELQKKRNTTDGNIDLNKNSANNEKLVVIYRNE
ncbi:unnamed protein product [Ambrosiozyma monospora]|uniref:Unnamed protein product n=1 Tax=Ambrosiozyma monospora TaxID=43982 RepID=A0ACB5T9V9_AMBMO|nr:unnamed protein product [Ambrosiozyma monospora]